MTSQLPIPSSRFSVRQFGSKFRLTLTRTLPHAGRDTRPPSPRRLMGAGRLRRFDFCSRSQPAQMILPDTSVWVEFFRGREPVFSTLELLLENREVIAA